METQTKRPTFIVTLTGERTVEFHCPHCKHRHVHGVHSVGGHVVAHCAEDDSPYRRTGYWLLLVEDGKEANC